MLYNIYSRMLYIRVYVTTLLSQVYEIKKSVKDDETAA